MEPVNVGEVAVCVDPAHDPARTTSRHAHKNTICSKKRHLCVIRYESLSRRGEVVSPDALRPVHGAD